MCDLICAYCCSLITCVPSACANSISKRRTAPGEQHRAVVASDAASSKQETGAPPMNETSQQVSQRGSPVAANPEFPRIVSHVDAPSLEEGARQARPWMHEYTQIGRGPGGMRGAMVSLGSVRFIRWISSPAKIARGATPRGCVGVLMGFGPPATVGALTAGQNKCMLVGAGTDWKSFTPDGYDALAIAIEERKWLEAMDACGIEVRLGRGEIRVHDVRPEGFQALGMLTRWICGSPSEPSLVVESADGIDRLADALLLSILSALQAPLAEPATRGRVARHRAALRAREFIDAHLDQPLSLTQVCRAASTSARALEYGFRELFGVSPMGYARCARLANVRHELFAPDNDDISVTSVAMRWGFWHLGQFSKDYRTLFAESPSMTLAAGRSRTVDVPRRTPRNRGAAEPAAQVA